MVVVLHIRNYIIVNKMDKELLNANLIALFTKSEKELPITDESNFLMGEKGEIRRYIGVSKEVRIPNEIAGIRVVSIGKQAFYKKGINLLTLPSGLKVIKEDAFEFNELEEVIIPKLVKVIGNRAFANNNIEVLTLPDHVKSLGKWCFAMNKIKAVKIPGSVKEVAYCSFYGNKLEELEIEDGVIKIGNYAFGNNLINGLKLPRSIKEVEGKTFMYNPLERLTIPKSLIIELDPYPEPESEHVKTTIEYYE